MLDKIYNWMMRQAQSKNAVWVLGIVSFMESSFFPLPPDPVLAIVVAKIKTEWCITLSFAHLRRLSEDF